MLIPNQNQVAEGRLSDIQIADFRNQHPSDIAEVLEKSDADPAWIVDVLTRIGNHKAIESFAQLSIRAWSHGISPFTAAAMGPKSDASRAK